MMNDRPVNTLYDDDILLWSEHQRDLLRRVAAGEAVNESPDWPNIIQEIEGVGNAQLHAVELLLLQTLLHMLKAQAWPDLRDVPHWLSEVRVFKANARRRYVPSMRRRIDLADLYADAVGALPTSIDGLPPLPVPMACPVTLDELIER